MGWLRLVGSLKLQVSFAKDPYKRDDILQKRSIILRSLLIEATPYVLIISYIYAEIRIHTYTQGSSTGDKERKKKKKKQEDVDEQGRPVLLKNCEIRGEPVEGGKMTAFAKRAKKIEVRCCSPAI